MHAGPFAQVALVPHKEGGQGPELKSLRPLARAAFAIEAAAAETKSFGGRYHNPENNAPRQHQQVVQAV